MVPKQDDPAHSGHDMIIGQDVSVFVHDTPASHAEAAFRLTEDCSDRGFGLSNNPYGIRYPGRIFRRVGEAKRCNE
jgi:hypothetical protein